MVPSRWFLIRRKVESFPKPKLLRNRYLNSEERGKKNRLKRDILSNVALMLEWEVLEVE